MKNKKLFPEELQINDKIRVTVNILGQKFPVDGTYKGNTNDSINILTNANPEPVELSLSKIKEITITEKYSKSGQFDAHIDELIQEFMKIVAIPSDTKNINAENTKNHIVIYNEFSFQHELGMYFRNRLTNYNITFERNIKDFNIEDNDTNNPMVKHEIDIVIEDKNNDSKFAIELKFPRKGMYPEQMYYFI